MARPRLKTSAAQLMCILIGSMAVGCIRTGSPAASATEGTVVIKAGGYVPTPPKRSLEVVNRFTRNMKYQLSLPPSESGFARYELSRRQEIARKVLLDQLGSEGGMPYYQLVDALNEVFDPITWQCIQFSCSVPYDLKPAQIPAFLKATRDSVAEDETLAHDEPVLRDQLLGSLTEPPIPRKDLREQLEELPLAEPVMPEKPVQPVEAEVFHRLLSDSERNEIVLFTQGGYLKIRPWQFKTVDELIKAGYSSRDALSAQARGQAFDKTLAKLPKSPGTVYRGINQVPRSQIVDLLALYAQKSLVTLGPDNLPATSSASRSLETARRFFDKYCPFRILYAIKQRSGVSVEAISRYPKEMEVLIPSQTLFQIAKIAVMDASRTSLYVELVELPRLGP